MHKWTGGGIREMTTRDIVVTLNDYEQRVRTLETANADLAGELQPTRDRLAQAIVIARRYSRQCDAYRAELVRLRCNAVIANPPFNAPDAPAAQTPPEARRGG